MSEDRVNSAAGSAMNAQIELPWQIRLANWWERQPPLGRVLVSVLTIGLLVVLTAWEANNAGQGWALIAKGTAPYLFAYLGGAAVTVSYVVFHHRAAEQFRKGRGKGKPWQPLATAIIAAVLSLFGVFANIASKTQVSAATAQEQNTDRAELRAEAKRLQAETSPERINQLEAMIAVNERIIAATLAEAEGWGMDNLDPEGACAADLKRRQRQLCNRVNGGPDDLGARNELALNQAALEAAKLKAERLKKIRDQLSSMRVQEGAAQWDAMSKIAGDLDRDLAPDDFRIWGSLLASLGFLFLAGMGWDTIIEARAHVEDDDGEGGRT